MTPDIINDLPENLDDEPETVVLKVDENGAGQRIDAWCAEREPRLSRSRIKQLIENGDILADGKAVRPSRKLKAGEDISIALSLPSEIEAKPENIPLDIVYEDSDVIVVNKPQGLVVHPAHGTPDGTLVNALLYHIDDLSGIGGELRPGIVHRIDKDTSGLLMAAKNDIAHQSLSKQLKAHSVTREYLALVKGIMPDNSGRIDMPVGRDPKNRKRMAVTDKNSKEAVTHFEVLERYAEGYTLCRFRLETGRTHQIRVHMKQIGNPLAGDPMYGGDRKNPFHTEGQLLHAGKLGFIHPVTGEYLEFTAPLPDYFTRILESLTPLSKGTDSESPYPESQED